MMTRTITIMDHYFQIVVTIIKKSIEQRKYSTGDVVGCGIHFEERFIFFTKNGSLIGTVDLNLPTKKEFAKSLNINCQIEPIKYNGIEDDGVDMTKKGMNMKYNTRNNNSLTSMISPIIAPASSPTSSNNNNNNSNNNAGSFNNNSIPVLKLS